MLARKNSTKPRLIVQPRFSKRNYIYDYHAYIIKEDGGEDFFGKGGGASQDQSSAKMKAIGEALERYCGSKIPNAIFRKTYEEIKNKALNPRKLIYFQNFQYSKNFSYARLKRVTPIGWVKGYSLTEKKYLYIPAFVVYLGYNRFTPNEPHFMPTSSNGLALSTSLEKATIKGIFELVERDAAMVTWYTKRIIPRLNLKYVKSPKLIDLRNKIRSEGLLIAVCISTIDVPIPSAIGIIYDNKKTIPYASFGLATETNLEEAAIKSLEEALMIRNTLEILQTKKKVKEVPPTSVKNLLDHVIFYALPSRQKYWNFLLKGPLAPPELLRRKYGFKEENEFECFENLISLFRKQKRQTIRVTMTNRIVKDMGYHVVRTLIPDLQPIDLDFNSRFWGTRRLYKFIRKRKQINPYPHPFG